MFIVFFSCGLENRDVKGIQCILSTPIYRGGELVNPFNSSSLSNIAEIYYTYDFLVIIIKNTTYNYKKLIIDVACLYLLRQPLILYNWLEVHTGILINVFNLHLLTLKTLICVAISEIPGNNFYIIYGK